MLGKSLFAVMALAVAVWSQDLSGPKQVRPHKVRPPHEHRGFFFSAGTGVTYTDLDVVRRFSYSRWNFSVERSLGYDEITRREFSGWTVPVMDFKIGKSIGNLVVVHSIFELALFSGEMEYSYSEQYEKDVRVLGISLDKVNAEEKTLSTSAFSLAGGLGLMFYPFRSPSSALNGFYFGISGGMANFVCFGEDEDSGFDQVSAFTQYEIGKDWWVSETWSVGVGMAFSMHSVMESGDADDGGDRTSIKFLVRITRG